MRNDLLCVHSIEGDLLKAPCTTLLPHSHSFKGLLFFGKLKVLYYLSGLECNDRNFADKAGAARLAAHLGLVLVCPDTSPSAISLSHRLDQFDTYVVIS